MSLPKPICAAIDSAVNELLAELYARCGGETFGLERQTFSEILREVAAKYLSSDPTFEEALVFLKTLRVDELALARACAAGSEPAWDLFLTRYREKLYQSALRIAREDSAARELADGLYAELYGISTREGKRVSKLASFTGRGSLEGWLRTVLAQEFVNRYRRGRRLVSLDEENEDGEQFAVSETEQVVSADPRLESSTSDALASLAGEDRMVLAAYYLDGRTLAQVARMMGVHESTISRKVNKLAKSLRKMIMGGLIRKGMSRRQAEEALEVDVRDLQINLRRSLTQEPAAASFSEQKKPMDLNKVAPKAKS